MSVVPRGTRQLIQTPTTQRKGKREDALTSTERSPARKGNGEVRTETGTGGIEPVRG